jgi:hypothetical protein
MKNKTEAFIEAWDVSPVFDQVKDDAGNGILGFTVHFTDSTFKNIIQSYTPETKKQVFSDMVTLRQSFNIDISASPTKQNTQIYKIKNSIVKRRVS